jgi:hypothetical protein
VVQAHVGRRGRQPEEELGLEAVRFEHRSLVVAVFGKLAAPVLLYAGDDLEPAVGNREAELDPRAVVGDALVGQVINVNNFSFSATKRIPVSCLNR